MHLFIEVSVSRVSLLFIFFVSFNSLVFAKDKMKKIEIPGAKCGNGEPYSVFISKKDPEKLVVTFQSGGACWSKSTCYGPNLRAIIKPPKKGKVPKIVSKTDNFTNHSQLYLPYCTGDTFSGSHIAQYDKPVYHYGAINVQKTIEYLNQSKKLKLDKVNDLIIFGGSAGGIGALIHADKFGKSVVNDARKTLIIDSPGLHFGNDFWDRFSPQSVQDFKQVFKDINFNAPLNDGFVAPYLAESCQFYQDWKIGFLMGSKDLVMSRIFGRISMGDHQKLVYSHQGIAETLSKTQNCSLWLKESRIHTFLQGFPTWKRKANGVRAIDFVTDVYTGDKKIHIVEKP